MALIDVIKYEGGNETLVWKHPREDFNTEAQLIVHESQEAIIFKDGVASNVYGPGKYAIKSDNIPGIKGLVALVTGGDNPNHCEVYFINKAFSMNVFWGTATPMTVQDPVWQVPFQVRAFGQFSVRVEESKKLLNKLVGTTNSFTSKALTEQFRGLLMSKIKDYICNQMVQKQRSFMEISAYLSEISENVKEQIAKVFVNYGLVVEEFYTESISVEQDDTYRQVRAAMAKRMERMLEGYDYATERSFDVAEKQAENQGTSGMMTGLAVGASVGMAAGPMVGGMMNRALQPATNSMNTVPMSNQGMINHDVGVVKPKNNEKKCNSCGTTMAGNSKFCPNCGMAVDIELKCVQCGHTVTAGAKFCSNCGAKQEV